MTAMTSRNTVEHPAAGSIEREQGSNGATRWVVSGDWLLANYADLATAIAKLQSSGSSVAETDSIDWKNLRALDTAGASLLIDVLGAARVVALARDDPDMPVERGALLENIGAAMSGRAVPEPAPSSNAVTDLLARMGESVIRVGRRFVSLVGFAGLVIEALVQIVLRPKRWRVTALFAQTEQIAFDAVPIVALLTFMVGAVIAFLGATVLADFGASIYTVDLIAFSFMREFGVLLTAILIAGRTASAFTAQIGSMKSNEEIDAMRAIGLKPVELLVVPRVMAMMISLPLLTFVGILSGLAGGALVCALTLDIPVTRFLSILQQNVDVTHLLLGLSKAPIFAFVIAVIGCLEGFRVAGSAQSVGEHTTSSVVQSIFAVILLDALAALFFMEMGW